MSAIKSVEDELKKYPSLKYSIEGNTISVDAVSPHGFSVWLRENKPGFTVGFEGWHEEFDNENEAQNCFLFGLCSECRLKVIKYGRMHCLWIVESKEGSEWKEDSRTGLILVPFWRKKSVEYFSNAIIKTDESHYGGENI